jgi:hypothetical protein
MAGVATGPSPGPFLFLRAPMVLPSAQGMDAAPIVKVAFTSKDDRSKSKILTERAVVHASGSAHAFSARTTTPVGARMSGGVARAAASTWIRGGGGTRSG